MDEDLLVLLVPGVDRVPPDPEVPLGVRLGLPGDGDVGRREGVVRQRAALVDETDPLAVHHGHTVEHGAHAPVEGLDEHHRVRRLEVERSGGLMPEGATPHGEGHGPVWLPTNPRCRARP